ncbi:FecR family protein [Sphingobacterium arenae]|uniref:FecR family protein n=1 Tax=Sphingobacterium arenae TaxID=1280598 RepID=A0ABR7XYB3_9SPHI|nr:FecR family protein [Sphingobacterium arenae]MBD1424018.1 FecR family protein [Sphingobacterium arenae]
MSEERFYQLISRKLAGEASVIELDELECYVRAYPDKKKLYDLLIQAPVDNDKGILKAEQAYALHQLKLQLQQPAHSKIPVSRKRFWNNHKTKSYILIAATIVMVIAAFLTFKTELIIPARIEVAATKGSITNIKLPDGSTVWLNSDSKITYRNNFGYGHRELRLTGEAFFDVKHDPKTPFIIHTDKINIKVLGTAFNVKSYPSDNYVETSLIRGKIDVNFTDRPSEHITLRPREKLTVNKDQTKGTITSLLSGDTGSKIRLENVTTLSKGDSIVAETAWLQNKIVFDNTSFSEIAGVLERRFDIKVKFKNEKYKLYYYTGIFQQESLREILDLMKITKPFNYEINKKVVTIN